MNRNINDEIGRELERYLLQDISVFLIALIAHQTQALMPCISLWFPHYQYLLLWVITCPLKWNYILS